MESTEAGGVIFGAIILIIVIGVLFSFPVMWCWNFVMPAVFNLPLITWGQAWCLTFLSSVFFKSYNLPSSNSK